MPISCFQMHMIHLWYCQVPKYCKTWRIFRKYVATVLCYSTDISSQLMVFFLLSELKSWWITATQGNLSTGDYASSVRRVTPVKGQLFWIPGQNPTRKYLTYCHSEPVYIMGNMLQIEVAILMPQADRIVASQRPLWTFSGHRTVCYEKARP